MYTNIELVTLILNIYTMKKLLIFSLLAFSFATMAQNQTAPAVTSIDEYNYLTEGLKLQLQTGGDGKQGYELAKIDTYTQKNFSFEYMLLKHKDSNQAKALLIIAKKEKDKPEDFVYMCLPFNNDDLFKKYTLSRSKLGISQSLAYEDGLSILFSKSVEKIANRCK